jgi:hypothetical protein
VLPLPGIHPQFSRPSNTYPCSPAPSELIRVLEVVWTFFTCKSFCSFFLEILSSVMKLKRHAATGSCDDNANTTGFYSESPRFCSSFGNKLFFSFTAYVKMMDQCLKQDTTTFCEIR